MPYRITKNCNQCERCAEVCAQGAIERNKNYKSESISPFVSKSLIDSGVANVKKRVL